MKDYVINYFNLKHIHINLINLIEGTGKSYVINSWRDVLQTGAIVAAPTGRAAHNVVGQTLHSLLQLPVQGEFKELSGNQLIKLQNTFKNSKMLIIDEYSMVGAAMLGYIDSRLRQARPQFKDCVFGNLSIILVGDPLQLPPVLDRALWNDNPVDCQPKYIAGLTLFKMFRHVILLTQQMRTNPEEQKLQDLIDNIRKGVATIDDWNVCKSRMIGNLSQNDQIRCDEAVYIMYKNDNVDDYNDLKLAKVTDQRTCRINAVHKGDRADEAKATDIGLHPYLRLCRGARIMITSNLWKGKGIVNGALGYVRHIIYLPNEAPPSLPHCIIVELDAPYKGPHLAGRPRHVPICPMTVHGVGSRGPIERTNFPIRLAWAITTTKVQGMTLPSIHVNLGEHERQYGCTNVAVSRVRSLNNLFFDSFDLSRITTKIRKPPLLEVFMERSKVQFEQTKAHLLSS